MRPMPPRRGFGCFQGFGDRAIAEGVAASARSRQPRKHDLWVGGNISSIYSAAFSPEGTLLALGEEDGEVWLWGIP
jgi:hypothetical protein